MAEDQIQKALASAAEAVAGRALNATEVTKIRTGSIKTAGASIDRAIRTIEDILGIQEKEIRSKCAASDNTNRKVEDLANAISNLKK